jgi:tetratricopeptide (TPR) repeat protein
MSIRGLIFAAIFTAVSWAAIPAVQEAKKLVEAKKYDEAITALEKAEKADPKAAEVKAAFAETYLAKGDSFMYNDALPPRMKYPQALRAYRKVLEYDKTNKKAQSGIATIEGIYKSMGRPVPQ